MRYSKYTKRELIEMLQSIQESTTKKTTVSSTNQTIQYLRDHLKIDWNIENFGIIFLDTQLNILCIDIVSSGTVDKNYLYPREIAKLLLRKERAKNIILLHNHPSGVLSPSENDINITRKLKGIADLLEIKLLDHLIVNDFFMAYFSFLENELLD